MHENERGHGPQKGDEYRHPDGTTEVVFMTEDGRVLSFREYPDTETFDQSVETATYRGVNDDVASLPDASAFAASDEHVDEGDDADGDDADADADG